MIVFVETLILNHVLSQIVAMCCFVPDNLIASITPLVVGGGNDPWTNHNFNAGDLSINGLAGNAVSKYLDTGINPAIALAPSSAGLSFYVTNPYAQAPVRHDFGAYDTGQVDAFELSLSITASNLGAATFNYGADLNVTPSGGMLGFFSLHCSSSAPSTIIYTANATTPFSAVVSSALCAGSLPSRSLYIWARNEDGAPGGFTGRVMSFAGIHRAMSAVDAQNFFNAVQALRVGLGGGFD